MKPMLWSEAGHPCPKCGAHLQRSILHDAVACLDCDEWLEPRCTDPCCWARCASRPARPSASVELEPLPTSSDPTHFFSRLVCRASDPDAARRLIAEAQNGEGKQPPSLRTLFPRRDR